MAHKRKYLATVYFRVRRSRAGQGRASTRQGIRAGQGAEQGAAQAGQGRQVLDRSTPGQPTHGGGRPKP